MVGDVLIVRGIEFQMTGVAERKELEPKLEVYGVGTVPKGVMYTERVCSCIQVDLPR